MTAAGGWCAEEVDGSWDDSRYGERGVSTHPFDPGTVFSGVRDASDTGEDQQVSGDSSSSNSSSSSIDDGEEMDVAWFGELLRPFDSGKRCPLRARIPGP